MSSRSYTVTLHLYDLSNGIARAMSMAILGKHLDGIWHSGIVVYGVEYFYGGGICAASAGHAIPHLPYQEISLGVTTKTQVELELFLQSINLRYTQATYSLLRHNCNNFADEVSKFLLQGKGIPDHIIKLPQEFLSSPLGATIAPMIEQMEGRMRGEVLGGGSGLNPFAHIQGRSLLFENPPIPSVCDDHEAEKKDSQVSTVQTLPNDTNLLNSAVEGIPVSVMDPEVKGYVRSVGLNPDGVLEDKFFQIFEKHANAKKRPILLSFCTIVRHWSKIDSFRNRLMNPICAVLQNGLCEFPSDNLVITTSFAALVNFTAFSNHDEHGVAFESLITEGLLPFSKMNISESTTTNQLKYIIMSFHNLLSHLNAIADKYYTESFVQAIHVVVKSAHRNDLIESIECLAKVVENNASNILTISHIPIDVNSIDVSEAISAFEHLSKRGISLENTLSVILQ